MDEQSFFHPPKFLDQNDPLIEHFWSLVQMNDEISCLWTSVANQVAAAHEGLAARLSMPLGNPDPVRQKGVVYLHRRLQALKLSPINLLLERLQVHAPDLVRVCGKFLHYNLESIILRLLRRRLGFPPEPPFRWRGQYLTAKNPIWVGPHFPERTIAGRTIPAHTITAIPDDVSGKHMLKVQTYINAFRPEKPRGRPRKPPGAPRTRQARRADPLARQAADLQQQGLRWRAIAQKLWPDEPLPTEHKAWERLRKRVERLIVRGRLDAQR